MLEHLGTQFIQGTVWTVIDYQYRLGIMNNKNVFRSETFFFQETGDSQDYSFPPENLFTLI